METLKGQKKMRDNLVSVDFSWKVENFSKLNNFKHYSDVFSVGDYKWQILLYPRGNNVDFLSVYLVVAESSKLPPGWSRHAAFSLTLVNQLHPSNSKTLDTEHLFNKRGSDWGFTSLIPLNDFCNPSKGYLVDDMCIIRAKVAVHKAEIKILEHQASSSAPIKPSDKKRKELESGQAILTIPDLTHVPSGPPIVKEPEDLSSPPHGELEDFRGLGKIEKAFVPLLDEVCSWHPSLIECQRKRSRMFTEWAFTALGRLLHFMKTKKVKDMTDEACEELKLLWEELEAFKFDLAWLEPSVQRALGVKKIVESSGKLKRLRKDVDALQTQTKRLRAELAVAEVNLEAAVRVLNKTQEGLDEIDINGELGYGRG
ncbi:MATH domain and coiled-coil domain-containing protein At3g58250-like [Malus sylvestris]|uniref:MATH domain and coiled-coil domain-containing protein At3g58250-like n=1 Tax=Malus sylvestris TaxID=3752 RepID=UPI0021ACD88A|nr:MATH domain and coiled-coil domain-containing protein At3g58250-like [Malus sylvestris]